MHRLRNLFFIGLASLFLTTTLLGAQNKWLEVEVGIIGVASQDVLEAAMKKVKEESYQGLIIILDTPGGALENTRKMVKEMINAPFPIIVWVGPGGARAASAGAFIVLAAHQAVMAEGTNIGAAHPIQADGKDVGKNAEEKVLNDTLAFIESLAERRGRNVDMARSFVSHSVSITESEALEHKIIDAVVRDRTTLFKQLEGKTVQLENGTSQTLQFTGAEMVSYEKSLRQQVLEIFSNPNLFYLLFMAGLIGLGFELTHPGAMFPGVAGAICMLLALISTSVLPVSFGAAALILLGVGLMVAETFVPSFGVLGIGGFVAFLLGSVFLVDPSGEQGLRVSWYTIVPGALMVAGSALLIGYLVLKSERSGVKSGTEGMVGHAAVAYENFNQGQGRVKLDGEIWQAKLADGMSEVPKGAELQVKAVDGLTLVVDIKHS